MCAAPYVNFRANNQDDPLVQTSSADIEYTLFDALTFSIITLPQSSKDILLSLESSENIDESNVGGYRSRRTRTRVVDTVEKSREVDHKPSARKSRREKLGLKLFTCRSRFEKSAQHQLVTAHFCLAIPGILHLHPLSSHHYLIPWSTGSYDALSFVFSAPSISFGHRRPHYDIAPERLFDRLCQIFVSC